MSWRLVVLLAVIACSANEVERTQQVAERRQAQDAVLISEVVESARTPASPGRLIYDPPVRLSRDSAGASQPDSVRRRR